MTEDSITATEEKEPIAHFYTAQPFGFIPFEAMLHDKALNMTKHDELHVKSNLLLSLSISPLTCQKVLKKWCVSFAKDCIMHRFCE